MRSANASELNELLSTAGKSVPRSVLFAMPMRLLDEAERWAVIKIAHGANVAGKQLPAIPEEPEWLKGYDENQEDQSS